MARSNSRRPQRAESVGASTARGKKKEKAAPKKRNAWAKPQKTTFGPSHKLSCDAKAGNSIQATINNDTAKQPTVLSSSEMESWPALTQVIPSLSKLKGDPKAQKAIASSSSNPWGNEHNSIEQVQSIAPPEEEIECEQHTNQWAALPIVEESPEVENPWATIGDIEKQLQPYASLAEWPWRNENDRLQKLVTLGHFVENYTCSVFAFPKHDQEQSALIRFLKTSGVSDILLKHIWRLHSTADSFMRTSQKSWELLMGVVDIWDVSGGNYQNCDRPRTEDDFATGIAPVVVVTQTRVEAEQPPYAAQVSNLHKMCLSMHNFADFLQNIQFHRVPFLSCHTLTLLIPQMRKLKNVGIYNCQLIHLGEGNALLDILKTDRPLGSEDQIHLDWYPTYHQGPKAHDGSAIHTYGVTWDDTGMYLGDSRKAIWQLVTSIILQARMQNINMESRHTAFRKWLDKSPCWKVTKTLQVILSQDSDLRDVVAWVDYPEFGGNPNRIRGPNIKMSKPEGDLWKLDFFTCVDCSSMVPGIYFDYAQIREFDLAGDPPTCLGCKLTDYLEAETDHYKRHKRTIIKKWLFNPAAQKDEAIDEFGVWNENNLAQALEDFHKNEVVKAAYVLDVKRQRDMHHERKGHAKIDHEYEEVQRPFSDAMLKRRGAHGIQAPTAQDKALCKDGVGITDTFLKYRMNAHGQPSTWRWR